MNSAYKLVGQAVPESAKSLIVLPKVGHRASKISPRVPKWGPRAPRMKLWEYRAAYPRGCVNVQPEGDKI